MNLQIITFLFNQIIWQYLHCHLVYKRYWMVHWIVTVLLLQQLHRTASPSVPQNIITKNDFIWPYKLNTHSLPQWVKASSCPGDRERLPVEHTRVIHNSSPVAPRDVCPTPYFHCAGFGCLSVPAWLSLPLCRTCWCWSGPSNELTVVRKLLQLNGTPSWLTCWV